MTGKRILYYTTKGKSTTQRVWKSLTTKGLSPDVYFPDTLSRGQQKTYDGLQEIYDFIIEDDELIDFEVSIYEAESTIEDDYFEEDFLNYDELLEDLVDVDKFTTSP